MAEKKNVLLIGGGAVGAIAALNIEAGGLGAVTAVLRSNFSVVKEKGYTIDSVDHDHHDSWRPTTVLNQVPSSSSDAKAFDYIVCVTKNCPDISPTLLDLISPAVTPSHTTIVLIQNGLNIEHPFLAAYPTNIVLSGVSMIDSHEASPGHIMHEEADILYLGPFSNPNLPSSLQEDKAKEFVAMYSKAGKTQCTYDADVKFSRWRKLVFNACLNPICAITGLDDARIRLADGALDGLVRPAMREIIMTAKALGVQLPEDIMDFMIHLDPMDLYLKPSMQCDIEKGNFLEFENLVGEPLREAEKVGVETPTLRVIYAFCKALQWRTKEARGKVVVPPKRDIREALD